MTFSIGQLAVLTSATMSYLSADRSLHCLNSWNRFPIQIKNIYTACCINVGNQVVYDDMLEGKIDMQLQNTPQFIVRSFKRHFRKVKEVAEILAASEGSFSFQYNYQEGTVQARNETPNDDATIRFVVLMRRFLDPVSPLYYKRVWGSLKEHFSEAISADHVSQLEQFIDKLNTGPFSFIVNQQEITAENIYHIVANGDYFGKTDEDAVVFLKNISALPIAGPLLLHQFYSYNLALFRVASILFDFMLKIECSEQYGNMFQEEISSDKRCIYCLSDTGTFTSEEHIVPESLGNYDTVLPKGFVCDTCNNEVLSGLDAELVNSDMLGLLKTVLMPYTKDGKLPRATYPNLTIKKTLPTHLVIKTKSKKNVTMGEADDDGTIHFSIKMSGRKKFDSKIIGRALYKIGLGMVAFHQGREAACQSKYDAARAFILKGEDFPNNLLLINDVKPHPQITSHYDGRWSGTCFQIDIYGVVFLFNLEMTPILEFTEEQLEAMNFSSFPLFTEE